MVARKKTKRQQEAAFNANEDTKQGYKDLIFCLEQLDKIEHAQDYDAIVALQKKYGTRTW